MDGAWWKVRSDAAELSEGDEVRVVGNEGLELLVERTERGGSADADGLVSDPE
jgi:membrane-bound ClpP family serine protease